MPSSAEIRRQFIDFFVSKHDHANVVSSPVVPYDDPTLLFANAGMNQFKPYFLGTETPDRPRAANTQKCIRAGGKHNDLDDVGRDTYHHTFFEMLGNWSFGDYFKAEAIEWAWELLTDVWGMDPKRLHVTYFEGDESEGLEPDSEAHDLWKKFLPDDHIHPGNKKDNFWEMGDTGPCGPCSEIHYDGTPDIDGGKLVNQDDPRVIEVWNLVFIQFNRRQDSTLESLPAKHIDTGMGFERIVRILQGKQSNYDTDVFTPIFAAIQQVTGAKAYAGDGEGLDDPVDIAYRVIADHIRCLSVALADGAHCGNKGRDAVLRSILRRAVRFGHQTMGVEEPFFYKLVPAVTESLGDVFPELVKHADATTAELKEEEEAFRATLDRGLVLFDAAADRAKQAGATSISGDDAFDLMATYGFPIDLTNVMAVERGMSVDMDAFEQRLKEHEQISRGAGGSADARQSLIDIVQKSNFPSTSFCGNDELVIDDSKVLATFALKEDSYEAVDDLEVAQAGALVVDTTPFYAEAGGQVGDTGVIRSHEGAVFNVDDTIKVGDVFFHLGKLETANMHRGKASLGEDAEIMLEVDSTRRRRIMSHHTATHVLNHKLRVVLGDHVQQKGSLVDDEKTRFDFAHNQAVTIDEAEKIEQGVNVDVEADLAVYAGDAPQEDALKIHGLRAVFGEKYPPVVRVVSIGEPPEVLLENPGNEKWEDLSIEFCGGTHVKSTGDIGSFTIISEEAVAKGVRRVTAVTGEQAEVAKSNGQTLLGRLATLKDGEADKLARAVAEITDAMGDQVLPLTVRAKLRDGIADLQKVLKEHEKQQSKAAAGQVVDVARAIAEQAEGNVIVSQVEGADGATLRTAMDVIRKTHPEMPMLLAAASEGKVALLASVPETTIKQGLKAGDWVRDVAKVVGGGGGGRPDMAQAGGKDPSKIDEALDVARAFAQAKLG